MIFKLDRLLFVLAVPLIAALAGAALDTSAQTPPSSSVTFRVEANNQNWLDIGLELADNQSADLTVIGTAGWEPGIVAGPRGAGGSSCPLILASAPVGVVLVRVGRQVALPAGESLTISGPGRVQAIYNDCPDKFFDNSGAFDVTLTLRVPAAATPATGSPAGVATPVDDEEQPAVAPPVQITTNHGGGMRFDPALPLLVAVIGAVMAAAWYWRGRVRMPRGPAVHFPASARLESTAWLAPKRLSAVQKESRNRRFLTIGGPDADIDFGLPNIWARLYPAANGEIRMEAMPRAGRILVDGAPLVVGQRLASGARVFMGTREFIYRSDADGGSGTTAFSRIGDLGKGDPRAAALR